MNTTPPTPQTEPLKNASGPDRLAETVNLTPFRTRMGTAIFKISEKVPTQIRSYLDAYLRHLTPTLAEAGDSFFPTSVRRHPRDANRTTSCDWQHTLYFHVGNAILTFYDAVLGKPVLELLESRVSLIEDIAKRGFKNFGVSGNDREGFMLLHKDERPIPFSTTEIA